MKTSLLLLNMGGPNNLSEIKMFLNNMFNDKAIIGAPKFIRKIIAYYIVKNRLKEATKNYTALGGKSPIVAFTQELASVLMQELGIDVHYIMRYTPPFAKEVLFEIKDYDKFYVVPLYPHFSSTTTQSSLDDLFKNAEILGIKRDKFVIIEKYYDNSCYNKVIVQKIKEALDGDDASEFELVFSAHGLPQKIIDNGDLYMKHIKQNVFRARKELLRQNLYFYKTHLAYQSRLGPVEWIKPYLDEKLKKLQKRKVIIYPIAFLIDNSETKFELNVEYKEIADKLGFTDFRVASAPNKDIAKTIVDIYQTIKKRDI
ncbi:MAG: ferrochelatase [Epsilonproteobacteria bacterium]|nr:ferrochelatase [Campylobacterota bacterium]